jgi:glc operon protein GlcG
VSWGLRSAFISGHGVKIGLGGDGEVMLGLPAKTQVDCSEKGHCDFPLGLIVLAQGRWAKVKQKGNTMAFTQDAKVLTNAAILKMLEAGCTTADAMGQPQCLVIVDVSGVDLGAMRMRGAKFLSLKSARAKAQTAASIGGQTANIPEAMRVPLAQATGGAVTALLGGLPIRMGGVLVGGVGVGSGSGAQDIEVGQAMLAAIGADVA